MWNDGTIGFSEHCHPNKKRKKNKKTNNKKWIDIKSVSDQKINSHSYSAIV